MASSKAVGRVLLALRKDRRPLTPQQRSGVILAVLLKESAKRGSPLRSGSIKSIMKELARISKGHSADETLSENSLASLWLVSELKNFPGTKNAREVAATAAGFIEQVTTKEPLLWGLDVLQEAQQTSYDEILVRLCTRHLGNPLTDLETAQKLIVTFSHVSSPSVLDAGIYLDRIIPSLFLRYPHDEALVQSLLGLLSKIGGTSADQLKWKISSSNLQLPAALNVAIDLMSGPIPGVDGSEFSKVARYIIADKPHSTVAELARRWSSAGIPFEVDVGAELARRLLERGDVVFIRNMLLNMAEKDRVGLIKQLLLWTASEDHRFAGVLSPLIEAGLSSESSISNPSLAELVEFAGKMDSLDAAVSEAIKRAVLESGRSNPGPAVLDFIENRILRGDDFLSLSSRDQLERELDYFSKIAEFRTASASTTHKDDDHQRVMFLSRMYQHSLSSDPALLAKCKRLLDSIDFSATRSSALRTTVMRAFRDLTARPRPAPTDGMMSLGDLRATEWNLICLSKGKHMVRDLLEQSGMGNAKDVYVRARQALDHPLASDQTVRAAVDSVHAMFRSVDDRDPEDFHDNLDWMLANRTLAWDTPSAGLHAAAIAGMCKNGLKFNDVTIARKISEYVNRKVIEQALAAPSSSSSSLPELCKEHALFVVAKACQFLQNDVVEFDEGCAQRASSLMEWFCSDEESNLFSALCATVESCTRDGNAAVAQIGLSAIRDSLVMEYLDAHAGKRPLYETMRKRLANVVLSTAEHFSMEQGHFAVLLAGLSACASFQAAEPNALWTDQGTRIPLLAAQYLRRKEKGGPLHQMEMTDAATAMVTTTTMEPSGVEEEENESLRELFVDYDQDPSEPSEVSSTVAPWIIHCGLVASSFRSPAMISASAKRKDLLSPVAKSNIGNALLTFLSLDIVREHPEKTLVPCINALASFAGRSASEWTRVDTKILLKTLRLAEKNHELAGAVLGVMREYARRPALGSLKLAGSPPSSTSSSSSSSHSKKTSSKKSSATSGGSQQQQPQMTAMEPKTHPLVDRVINVVLTALPSPPPPTDPFPDHFTVLESVAVKPLDPVACINGFKTVSGVLENLSDPSAYQHRLYQSGFLRTCIASLVPYIVAQGPEEVAESACLALQNVVAFQPAITAAICKRSVEVLRVKTKQPAEAIVLEPFETLAVLLYTPRAKDNPKLITAAMGAYFALLQADPEASLEVTKLIRNDYNLLSKVVDLRDRHSEVPVLRETAEALAEFLKKQYLFMRLN